VPSDAVEQSWDEAAEDGIASAEVENRELTVGTEHHGQRVDKVLALGVSEFSRSYLQQLLADGAVTLNGKVLLKPSVKVAVGDRLRVEMRPTQQSMAFQPEAMDLQVVYEDEDLLVINKPAGLVVHPAPGNWTGTLLNGLLARDEKARQVPRAGIVHRLDKDTSGLMVVARNRSTMDALIKMIAARDVSRQYLALAHKQWGSRKRREVDAPIGRDPRNRLRMAVVDLNLHPASRRVPTSICSMAMQRTAWCAARCTPAARTRSGCTWLRSAIR
jgi:23S rRNA pseudouridine1911/1915/1917 synthase